MLKQFSVVLILILCLAGCRQSAPDEEKPNILFIFIDDMGYGDPGCYGNDELETPNIDRLASEGIRFTRFYVNAPICSPSRVAVTTGQYPSRWGITSFIDSREHNQRRGIKNSLDIQAPSVARELKAHGYYTAHVGKWHMGGSRDVGDVPLITEYGFDESVTQFEGLGERFLATYETLDLGEDSTRNLEKWSAALGRGEVHWYKRYEITARFVDRVIRAMENARKENKPFYINLWTDDVHTPLEPSPANRGDGSIGDLYAGVVKELDRELGRLFDYIRDKETLRENTLIVLASDNGPSRAGSAGPFRGGKGTLYEGGIREPFIVWYPGRMDATKRGTVNRKNCIAGMDLPPAFLSLAGIKYNIPFDGMDVSKALMGLDCPERDQPIMWQRPPGIPLRSGVDNPDLAIRMGDFKLLMNTDSSGITLYNTKEDPSETRDLSARYPEKADSMKQMLLEWYSRMPPLVDPQ